MLSPLSPTPGFGTGPLPHVARPPGVATIDVLYKREQDATGKDGCPPAVLQQTRWVASEYIY